MNESETNIPRTSSVDISSSSLANFLLAFFLSLRLRKGASNSSYTNECLSLRVLTSSIMELNKMRQYNET